MNEYYNIVPWLNSDEWLEVYNNIYTTSNKELAHKTLLVWKARIPSLPSGIESTLTLLEVLIQEEKSSDVSTDHILRLAFSSAIMRFVNHMLDSETAKGTSLYQAAKNLGVPDWIIDLRHDVAHSNNLPSVQLLKEAAQIGLEWLHQNYWLKYKECIKDYVTGKRDDSSAVNNNISALIHFCTSLSFCAHTRCKIKNLSEIPDAQMRESIVNDARDLLGDQLDFSNLRTVSVSSLINILNLQSKKLFRKKDTHLHVNSALLEEDSLFLSLDVLNLLGGGEFHNKRRLSPSYMQCFEVLLTFLHTNDILVKFILGLVDITNKLENDHTKRLLAALWISEILKALRKSKQFLEKIKSCGSGNIELKKKRELRSLYHHWFPNEKVNGFLLDIQKPVPEELMDIKFLQPIISSYNPYLKYFIRDLLNLVEPCLPKHVIDKIFKLTELISCPEKFPIESSKIYTVDDLNLVKEENIELIHEETQQNNISMEINMDSDFDMYINHQGSGIWQKPSESYDWSKFPIGLLPWQIN